MLRRVKGTIALNNPSIKTEENRNLQVKKLNKVNLQSKVDPHCFCRELHKIRYPPTLVEARGARKGTGTRSLWIQRQRLAPKVRGRGSFGARTRWGKAVARSVFGARIGEKNGRELLSEAAFGTESPRKRLVWDQN